jgi:hypothetical protein
MTLIEILEKNKANLSIKLEPGGDYTDYFAHLSFEDNKIHVEIYNDEGGSYQSDEEPMPYAWIEMITKLVNDLKEAKAIPDYTLNLIPETKTT